MLKKIEIAIKKLKKKNRNQGAIVPPCREVISCVSGSAAWVNRHYLFWPFAIWVCFG